MEASTVSSVSSSLQQQYSSPRPPQESERPRESEASRNTTSTANTQQTSTNRTNDANQEARRVQAQVQQQQEQPKPVVNAQGQKIGSIINETA